MNLVMFGIAVLIISLFGCGAGKLLDLDQLYSDQQLYDEVYNKTMEWGTYKPNVFFGIKNRAPIPITVGLVWAVPDTVRRTMTIRHTQKYQSGDGVTAYYEYHDGWGSSRQIIEDPQANARFEIDFIKQVVQDDETKDLKSQWKALITIKPIKSGQNMTLIPFVYISHEQKQFFLQQKTEQYENQTLTKVLKVIRKISKNEAEYFEFENLPENQLFNVLSLEMTDMPLWNIEGFFLKHLKDMLLQPSITEPNSNLIIARLPQPLNETKFIISYNKRIYKSDEEAYKDSILMSQNPNQTLADFDLLKQIRKKSFDNKFEAVFKLTKEKFEKDKILNDFKDHGVQFSKEALSGVLGGIGYFYGPVQIKQAGGGKIYDQAAGLFTGTPSRSRFPRGFLWDEGFHLLITCQWSQLLCMDILSHWFNSMKPSGWIPREQIRGPEAESVVPAEFITQDPKLANPPSMMFPMKFLIQQANRGDEKLRTFLNRLYSKWQKWFEWFFKSQENRSLPNTFSWKGRTSEECMPSGLDDYPRGFIVNEGSEIHLDLQSWMVEFSAFMSTYSELVGDSKKVKQYQTQSINIKEQLLEKLFNQNTNLYSDFLGFQWEPKFATNKQLAEPIEWRADTACGASFESSLKTPAKCSQPYTADQFKNAARCCKFSQCTYDPKCSCASCTPHISIDDDYNVQLMNQFSVHTGIVNFFPLMFGLIEDEEKVKSSLRMLADSSTMLSNAGIRSLSKQDQFYLYKSNYWRGAVWINVNFLVLRGLFKNYLDVSDFTSQYDSEFTIDTDLTSSVELYQTVRKRLIASVYKNWRINHMFWEQYDNESGLGLMTHPFTGWTTLILLVMSENYA